MCLNHADFGQYHIAAAGHNLGNHIVVAAEKIGKAVRTGSQAEEGIRGTEYRFALAPEEDTAVLDSCPARFLAVEHIDSLFQASGLSAFPYREELAKDTECLEGGIVAVGIEVVLDLLGLLEVDIEVVLDLLELPGVGTAVVLEVGTWDIENSVAHFADHHTGFGVEGPGRTRTDNLAVVGLAGNSVVVAVPASTGHSLVAADILAERTGSRIAGIHREHLRLRLRTPFRLRWQSTAAAFRMLVASAGHIDCTAHCPGQTHSFHTRLVRKPDPQHPDRA